MFARKLTEEELTHRPASAAARWKPARRCRSKQRCTPPAATSRRPRNTSARSPGPGDHRPTTRLRGRRGRSAAQAHLTDTVILAHQRSQPPTCDTEWDWLDRRTKIDTDMRLRKLGIRTHDQDRRIGRARNRIHVLRPSPAGDPMSTNGKPRIAGQGSSCRRSLMPLRYRSGGSQSEHAGRFLRAGEVDVKLAGSYAPPKQSWG